MGKLLLALAVLAGLIWLLRKTRRPGGEGADSGTATGGGDYGSSDCASGGDSGGDGGGGD